MSFLSKWRSKWTTLKGYQRRFATYIIESDEAIHRDPDNRSEYQEDMHDWALDLARTIINRNEEERIRKEVEIDV